MSRSLKLPITLNRHPEQSRPIMNRHPERSLPIMNRHPERSRRVGLAMIILLFSSFFAQAEERQERLRRLYEELRCPTCQGLSVKDSEAGFSRQIRGKVDELVDQGYTDDQITDFFLERYGEWILRSPPKSGVNWILWLAPGVVVLLGMSFVLLRIRRNAKQSTEEPGGSQLSSEEQAAIEKDLQRFYEPNDV